MHMYLLEVTRERGMYKKTYYEMCISPDMPNLFITWCKAYQILKGTGPLKPLHLYGNIAIVTTSKQACMSPCRAYTCLFGLCSYSVHVTELELHMYMYRCSGGETPLLCPWRVGVFI